MFAVFHFSALGLVGFPDELFPTSLLDIKLVTIREMTFIIEIHERNDFYKFAFYFEKKTQNQTQY